MVYQWEPGTQYDLGSVVEVRVIASPALREIYSECKCSIKVGYEEPRPMLVFEQCQTKVIGTTLFNHIEAKYELRSRNSALLSLTHRVSGRLDSTRYAW
jgi:hypothetical protein